MNVMEVKMMDDNPSTDGGWPAESTAQTVEPIRSEGRPGSGSGNGSVEGNGIGYGDGDADRGEGGGEGEGKEEEEGGGLGVDIGSVLMDSWQECATALADICITVLSTPQSSGRSYPPRVRHAALNYLRAWQEDPRAQPPLDHRQPQPARERPRPPYYRRILPAVAGVRGPTPNLSSRMPFMVPGSLGPGPVATSTHIPQGMSGHFDGGTLYRPWIPNSSFNAGFAPSLMPYPSFNLPKS